MLLPVNRRMRDKAVVFGLPAERFMLCLGLMFAPMFIVIFSPFVVIGWIPWAWGAYIACRDWDTIMRRLNYGKQFPSHLKNR